MSGLNLRFNVARSCILKLYPEFWAELSVFLPEGFWVSPYVHFPFILGKALNRKRPDCWDAVKELKLSYCNVGTC